MDPTHHAAFGDAVQRPGKTTSKATAVLMAAQAVGSLVITSAGQITRARLTPTTVVMITNDGTAVFLNIAGNNATAAGHLFLGAVLNCSYNFN